MSCVINRWWNADFECDLDIAVGGGYFANKISISEEYCENFFMSGLWVSSQWAFITFYRYAGDLGLGIFKCVSVDEWKAFKTYRRRALKK